jgi:hypothetical protein
MEVVTMGRQASGRRSATVIDLQAFKARRAAETTQAPTGPDGHLPLFDGAPAPPPAPAPGPRARRLSEAEVQHRKRMLSFLRASGRQ